MKKFFNEFREFAMRGNVLDMAIGVVLGSAFGKITTSLVNDAFMPLIGLVIGGIDLGKLDIILKPAVMNGDSMVYVSISFFQERNHQQLRHGLRNFQRNMRSRLTLIL